MAAQGNRYSSLGGAVGTFKAGNVTHVENNGNVTYQDPGTAIQTTVAMGGIVARINEGGNTAVAISNCSNSGTIYENGGSDVTLTAWKATAGIVGYVGQPATISQCSNTGTVQFNYNTKANGRSSYVGGIVGVSGVFGDSWAPVAGSVSIQNCTNYGTVQNQNFNNTYTAAGGATCGGIAGTLYGASDNKIAVSGCNNLTTVGLTGTLISKRGYQGGIVGYASNVNISNCSCTKSTSSNIPRYCGGIAGQMVASSAANCTVEGTIFGSSDTSHCDMGGIAGIMDETSSVSNCDVINIKLFNGHAKDGTGVYKYGAIAGTTVAGASITDCKLSGGWSTDNGVNYTPFVIGNVCSDSNATMSGNALYSQEYDITGTVSCGGNPLAGVVVSDGYQSVVTGSDGKYYIKADEDATCVSVSIPSGYMPAVTGGLAAFYKKLSTVTPSAGIRTVDFPMNTVSNPDQFTILAYSDIQIRGTSEWGDNIGFHSTAVAKDVFHDIKDKSEEVGGNVIGLSMGDQANYAKDGEYTAYTGNQMLGSLGFANFCIPGNHDYDSDNENYFIDAVAKYESCLSPSRYSFNYGKFHIVMVDNAQRAKVEKRAKSRGLTDPTWQWLQSDLKYVPKSTPIILCSHQPLFTENYHNTDEGTYYKRDNTKKERALNPEYATLLSSYKRVYAFNGDTHNSFHDAYSSTIEVHSLPRATGALWLNQFINMCGTPRGYMVLTVDGTDLTYKFHPVKYQTASVSRTTDPKAPSSMTYRDFSLVDGVFHMKNSYYSNPGAELGDFYQIHAYAPGAYTGNDGAYEDDVLATVFMYDQRWSKVTFQCTAGTLDMTQIDISQGVHDPGFTWLYDWYYTNISDSFFKQEFTNDYANYNIFRCTPPAGVTSGTVYVTDHFGNDYEYRLSW